MDEEEEEGEMDEEEEEGEMDEEEEEGAMDEEEEEGEMLGWTERGGDPILPHSGSAGTLTFLHTGLRSMPGLDFY
ncbi:hypothetical protein NQZ68_025931 [Dissostichus eleginoides]|nr:hypothetical protein NQZ68_025931 [Dissostichus eleginoides]